MSALVPQEAQIAEVPELPDVAEEKLSEIAEAPKEEPPADPPVEPTPDPPADVPEREAEDVLMVDDSLRDAPQEQEPDKAIEEILNLKEIVDPEEIMNPEGPKVEPNASDLEKPVVPPEPEAPKSDILCEIVNPEEPLPASEHQVSETAPEPDVIMVEEPPPTPEPEVSEPATVLEIVVAEILPAEQPAEPVSVYVPTSDFIPPLATPTPQGTPLSRPAPSVPLPPQTLNVYFHGKHRFSKSSHPRLLFKHPREKNLVYLAQYCATSKRIYNEGGGTILVYRGLDGARIEGVSISNGQMTLANSEGKRNFLSALRTRVDSSYVTRDVALPAGAEFCPAGYQWKIFLGLIKKLELETLGKVQIAKFRPRKTFRDASRFHMRRKVGRLDIVGGLEEELVDQVVVSFVGVMVEAKAALIKNRRGNKPESSAIPSPVPPSNGDSIAGSEQFPSQEQPAGSEPPTSAEAPANWA